MCGLLVVDCGWCGLLDEDGVGVHWYVVQVEFVVLQLAITANDIWPLLSGVITRIWEVHLLNLISLRCCSSKQVKISLWEISKLQKIISQLLHIPCFSNIVKFRAAVINTSHLWVNIRISIVLYEFKYLVCLSPTVWEHSDWSTGFTALLGLGHEANLQLMLAFSWHLQSFWIALPTF